MLVRLTQNYRWGRKLCVPAAANARRSARAHYPLPMNFSALRASGGSGTGVASDRGGQARPAVRPHAPKAFPNLVRRSNPTQAFTLIESMIVVMIVGLVAAAIMPAMNGMMADNRQSSAANELLRVVRRARADAFATGLAHRVTIDPGGDGGFGSVDVEVAMRSSCLRSPQWLVSPGRMRIGNDFNNGGDNSHLLDINVRQGAGTDLTSAIGICYQPNGETWLRIGNETARQSAPLLLLVRRTVGVTQQGLERQIVVPVGGTPRMR